MKQEVKTLITDVSRVLLFPKEKEYGGSLNGLYKEKVLKQEHSFFNYFEVNTELLAFYRSLRKEISIHILTSDIIQDAPELQPFWDKTITSIFSASKIGTHKSEPAAYRAVLSKLAIEANETLYIDDNSENIEAARSAGLQTIRYTDNQQVITEIRNILY